MSEQPQLEIPFWIGLPQPLPKQTEDRERNDFLKGVEKGLFGETGPVKPGMRTIVTQKSLDHYMAQQWNLDIDNFPASLPYTPALEAVKRMYHHYSFKANENMTIKGGNKQTLTKKMKEWTKGEEERKLMDIEIMYLKSNQDPKLYDLIMDTEEVNDDNMRSGSETAKRQMKK